MLNYPSHVTTELEEQRLMALYSFDILGEQQEPDLDNLVKLAGQIINVPTAYVALVDRDEVVLKSVYGEIFAISKKVPRSNDILSQFTMWSKDIFLVNDTLLHEKLSQNTMVLHEPHIRFYCSISLKDSDGFPLGCLTLLDVVPRNLRANDLETLKTLAVQIITHLELKRKNTQLQVQTKKLEDYRNTLYFGSKWRDLIYQ